MEKSFVKWEDDIIFERIMRKNVDPEMILHMEEEEFADPDAYELLRDIVTTVDYAINYYDKLTEAQKAWYGNLKLIKDKLNRIIDYLLAEELNSYCVFDEIFNKSERMKKQKYLLLNRISDKGYFEIRVLKQVCWYLHYINYSLCNDIKEFLDPRELRAIFTCPLYEKFIDERIRIDYDSSPESFKIFNERRKERIKKQDEFVRLMLLEGDYDEAFKMIEDEVKRVMERVR